MSTHKVNFIVMIIFSRFDPCDIQSVLFTMSSSFYGHDLTVSFYLEIKFKQSLICSAILSMVILGSLGGPRERFKLVTKKYNLKFIGQLLITQDLTRQNSRKKIKNQVNGYSQQQIFKHQLICSFTLMIQICSPGQQFPVKSSPLREFHAIISKREYAMSKQLFHGRRHSLTISNTINEKGSPIKKRIAAEYMPKYYKKLRLENKRVLDASQDRLSELTTKQIDRLIEMQKIKSLLNDNKKGIRPTHINFTQCQKNKHPNVYQPNFLAKINRIAIERNIYHLRSQEFDQGTISPKQLRQLGFQLQKKNLKFVKQYKIDMKKKDRLSYEQQQQKSISSINQEVQQFQSNLQQKKCKSAINTQILNKFKHKQTNILSMTRWFNGMSTHYLNLDKPGSSSLASKQDSRPKYDRNYDLQHQNNYFNNQNRTKSKFNNSRLSTVA